MMESGGKLSAAEYDEAEATAIAEDILDRSYQYGDDLEPLARFYLALVAERDVLEKALNLALMHLEDPRAVAAVRAALERPE